MNYLNLIIILIIIYITYLIVNEQQLVLPSLSCFCNKKKEPFAITKNKTNDINNNNDIIVDDIIDNIQDWDKTYVEDGHIKKKIVKPNFNNSMFNNDYRDIITTFNDFVPCNRQIFNVANIPLKYSEPNNSEVKKLVNGFLHSINKYVKTNIDQTRSNNAGWDEPSTDPNVQSGWDKVHKKLGINNGFHPTPLGFRLLKLISIEKLQKYETEDEIKYLCQMVIEKNGSESQMLIHVSFVIKKNSLDDNVVLGSKSINNIDVYIENISIEGYLSNEGNDDNIMYKHIKEKHYEIDGMEQNNLTDPKYVQHKLLEHKMKLASDMEFRNSSLDEQGKAFHSTLPNPYDYDSHKVTQTIEKDFNR